MLMLINCSSCRTPLQLPAGATSIRCAVCHAITHVGAYLPSSSSFNSHYTPPPAPAPYNHVPSVHGQRKAVIVGISYRNSRSELKGCINDAKCMKYLLVNRFKFPESSILMLTGNPRKIPNFHVLNSDGWFELSGIG